jgi:transposase
MRIKYRWEAIDLDNQDYKKAKKEGAEYKPHTFENGDTLKQLLVRSRYLLFKPSGKWNDSQKVRANILFNAYPDIEQAYDLSHHLYLIYSRIITKPEAMKHLAKWFNQIELAGIDTFNILKRTFENHYQDIINLFDYRSTNAAAESFNAKVKEFRRQFIGVDDVKFFLFRLTKIFA